MALMLAGLAAAGVVASGASGASGLLGPGGGEAPWRLEGLGPELVCVEGVPLERVRLSVSVMDREGRPIRGLNPSDFLVLEKGVPQTLVDFGREADRQDRPLSAVFLVDRSGSIGHQMSKWRMASISLLSALRPVDEVKVATFTTEVTVLQEFTHDAATLAGAVEKLEQTGGGTRVFRAVDETLHDLRRRAGRKVIFLLTDGLDSDRPEAWTTMGDAYLTHLVQLAVDSQVIIVTILPGPTGYPSLAAQDLAVQTGGWWLYPSDDLPGLVRRLGERLLESYYLAYDSTRPLGDPRRRQVAVSVARPDLGDVEVRTIGGIFGDAPLLDLLEEELDFGQEEERARAVIDLGMLPGPDSEAPLRKALRDKSPKVRALAAELLGKRGVVASAERLARLLKDPDPGVRRSALAALRLLITQGTQGTQGDDEAIQSRILDAAEAP